MIINILAGGPPYLLPSLLNYNGKEVVWVGVDRGVFTLLSQNLKPVHAFGDFDSVTEEEYQLIQKEIETVHVFRPEKDETDLELALNWALQEKPDKIRIFGATGGRADHFMANIQLLIKPVLEGNHVPIKIIDKKNVVFSKGPGAYTIKKRDDMKYISFVPVTPLVKKLTLTGFKYPLTNRTVSFGSTLCISNELICDEGTFSFSDGILMVIRSSD